MRPVKRYTREFSPGPRCKLGAFTIAELRPGTPVLDRFARVDVLPDLPDPDDR